jgi:site-specific recombinase XerD
MNAPFIPNLPAIIYSAPLPALPIEIDISRAADYAKQDKAESTRKAYRSDFRLFEKFCRSRGVASLPAAPETVAAFLASEAEAGLKPSTIGRRCAAIRYAHRLAGHDQLPTNSEAVKATLRGIRRVVGVAPRRMAPAVGEIVRDMARAAPAGLKGLRDRALLLVGFGGAFRRSELVALDVADIEFTDDGMRVTIRRSKTDVEGLGQTIAIVRGSGVSCPVKALRAWFDASGITEGAVFRQVRKGGHLHDRRLIGECVRRVVKAYAGRLGLNPADFGAHSLRSGPLTSGAARGASLVKLKELSRHKGTDVLVNNYIRPNDLFRDHCLSGVL